MKPISAFYYKNRAEGTRQAYCKACKTEYNRAWYAKHRSSHIERVLKYRTVSRKRNAAVVRLLKEVPCMDCGQTFDPCAMDFDHVRGKKIADVAALVNSATSLEVILAEIAKCDVVCSNCHRVRTKKRGRAGHAALRADPSDSIGAVQFQQEKLFE